jgi:hypothetical protein
MKPKPAKPPKDTEKDIREFDKLPAKTKELLILGDSEEHTIGTEKVAIQKSIRRRAAKQ